MKEALYTVRGRTPSGTFTEWTDVKEKDLDWYRSYLGDTFEIVNRQQQINTGDR